MNRVLKIRVLGDLTVHEETNGGDVPVPLRGRQPPRLLALLALTRDEVTRNEIFRRMMNPQGNMTNCDQRTYEWTRELRRQLPETTTTLIETNRRGTLRLNRSAGVWVDLDEFRDLRDRGEHRAALELVRGDLAANVANDVDLATHRTNLLALINDSRLALGLSAAESVSHARWGLVAGARGEDTPSESSPASEREPGVSGTPSTHPVAGRLAAGDHRSHLRVTPNQDAALPTLEECVGSGSTDVVEFIEYAGQTTLPLIRAVIRARRPLKLLVKHPETVEGIQQQRTIATLDTIYTTLLCDYAQPWEVRCYRLPYSLRARRIGTELLEIGWLTPNPQRKTAHGHDNPSILIDPRLSENDVFVAFFQRSFDVLWLDESTEDGAVVFSRFAV